MQLRAISFAAAITMAVLAAYYAGFRHGVEVKMPKAEADESERTIPQPARDLDDADVLVSRHLAMPIDGLKSASILDTFNQARSGGKRHEATDIMAPRGTPIHAMQDGTIKKLFLSKAGGNTIYEFDPQGIYCFYYAHLDRYADGLHEGMQVKKGDVIGYVGSTGDAAAEAPHLHLAIFKLGPEKNWWQGTAINPYPVLMRLLTSDF